MLIIKAYVNKRKIDEIHIQNMGETVNGFFIYEVKKPKTKLRVFHKREDGWKFLASMVLDHLVKGET